MGARVPCEQLSAVCKSVSNFERCVAEEFAWHGGYICVCTVFAMTFGNMRVGKFSSHTEVCVDTTVVEPGGFMYAHEYRRRRTCNMGPAKCAIIISQHTDNVDS